MPISNNKKIAKNTLFLYVRMFFVLIVSLYTSRVVLNALGVDGYGVYNVVAGFVSMFGFLNATLSSSMQRFYNFESSTNGIDGYKKVYYTGIIIHFLLAIFLLAVLESFGLWYVNNIMVIPESSLTSANVVFQTSILSMILVILQIPFTGAIMADERMDYYAVISIVDVILKLFVVLLLPKLPYNKLIIYGCLLLIITIIDTTAYIVYAKRTVLKFKFKFLIDKPLFRSILSFSGWNMLGTFAFLLKGQGLNMLLNTFFGTTINAARGIAYQVNGAINGFSANLSMAFRPQIVNSYAKIDYKQTKKLFFLESKICFSLMILLMIPIIFEMDYILNIWLGNIVPENTNIFAMLVLLDSLVCTLNTPCTQVAYAVGNLKKYQIITSIVNICLLPACWISLKIGFSSISVFIITIIFSIFNQITCLILLNKLFPFGLKTYIRQVCLPCFIVALIIPIFPCIISNCINDGFLRLLFVILSDIIIGIPVIYYSILSIDERESISRYIKNSIKIF